MTDKGAMILFIFWILCIIAAIMLLPLGIVILVLGHYKTGLICVIVGLVATLGALKTTGII